MRDDVRRTPRDIDEETTTRFFDISEAIRIFPGLCRTVRIRVFCIFVVLFIYFLGLSGTVSGTC